MAEVYQSGGGEAYVQRPSASTVAGGGGLEEEPSSLRAM